MLVAVTGATGFLGRYIVRQLVRQGHSCRLWCRKGSDRSGFETWDANVEWIDGTLGDAAASAHLVQDCDAVVHAALDRPSREFRGNEGDLIPFVQRNLVGSLQLIEEARAAGVARFIYISTCAVHERILDDRPLDETHPLWPLSHYGAHKAAVEAFVHSYGFGHNFAICALRPTGIYGVAHVPSLSKWYRLVQDVVAGKDVVCRSGGKEVHAQDVAAAVGLLLTAPNISGESYSCYDRYVSEFEVATLAQQISQSTANITGSATTPKHQIVTEKIKQLGQQFGGTRLLQETIEQLVRHVQSQ
ncbi:MAG: NAD(P)-dependent oxidoreductase [Planctomycetota bacterium]|nr:NAD(P)-dependent oxidoreductase [Planctomycetota bacterium]